MRRFAALPLLAAMLVVPAAASAKCSIGAVAQLPVTLTNHSPIVTVQLNGRDAKLILDSGSFFGILSRATVQEYKLPFVDLNGRELHGVGGTTTLNRTEIKQFGLAGHVLRDVQFGVAGSDMGYAGVLGQNVLGVADVEYDLPHGLVRIMQSGGCDNGNMAYWAAGKPASGLPIESLQDANRQTVGTVKINGVNVHAMFDSGASAGAMLTLEAAKRIGITPDSPGVTPAGFAVGFGEKRVRIWRAKFDKIDIGGEIINKPTIQIIDDKLGESDITIGIDFFLSHRIYVDNRTHRMFFTYEGGPVFGLDPKGAVDDKGNALDLTNKSGDPTDAAGFSRRGAVFLTDRKFDAAIADFDKAVAMAPDEPQYLVQRGLAHLSNRQPLLGAADLDKAIEIAPGNTDARLARAQLRLGERNSAGALADLKAIDDVLAPSSGTRLQLAAAYINAGSYDPAVASLDLWLKSHIEDHNRAVAFNDRCRARALANRELDKALDDCEAALRLVHDQHGILENRGLVHYRRGEFDKAVADLTAVAAAQPKNALAFYTRALVERKMGKTADADKDRAAALAINPQIGDRAKGFGLEN